MSDPPAQPASTFGWRNPVVLLPSDWPEWSDGQRRAVLAHEIAHVRMRHVARRSEGQTAATLATLAGVVLVALGGDPSLLMVAQGLNVSLQLKHTRDHEAESDREGGGRP